MIEPPPLRVWLDPRYDHGRFGVWLLDLPGAFGWAATRDLALSQAPSTAGWYRDWLARHGDAIDLVVGPLEIVEEIPAQVADAPGRKGRFAADDEPVTPEELDVVIRRLEYARADLLELVDRLTAFESAGGHLPPGDDRETVDGPGVDPTRAGLEVVRHIGSSETWLGSRLDPTARFDGPDRDGDVGAYLAATRAWLIEALRRQHALDPALARVDGRGESWTMRKVVRRVLYHSIDHLRELDRRLARGERRADRLAVSHRPLDTLDPLVRLLRSVGWDRRVLDRGRIERAIAATRRVAGAWDGDELVGFARDLGDGEFNGLITMVVVDPRWQGLGVAPRLIHALVDDLPEVRFRLGAAGGLDEFYGRLGFERDDRAFIRRRRT
jgi:GNAT superfamily N-acetyltransferase